MDSRRRNFGVLATNVLGDFNMACLLRTHNAFLGSEFYYMGKKKYYRPGSVGVHHYEHLTHFSDLDQAREGIPKDFTWVGIDNIPGAVPLDTFEWPEKPLLVFGNETNGLDFVPNLVYHCKHVVEIPQFGSVRSLNVAVAGGIVMYDLCLQQGWLEEQRKSRRNEEIPG